MAVTDLHALAVDVKTAAETLLATTSGGTPARSAVVHAEPAYDCEQLTVHVAQIGEATSRATNPLDPGHRDRSGRINLQTLIVTVIRCGPTVSNSGKPPAAAAVEAAAAIANQDAWALWNGLYRLKVNGDLFDSCDEVFFDAMLPAVEEGGFLGWTMQIRVALDGYDPGAGS